MEQFDIAVIGGGPGGYIAAIRCAQLGKKTALIERADMGGTCLNRGCIPTKALLHTAELYGEIKNHGKELGINASGISVDYGVLAARKDAVVSRLRRGVEGLVKGRNITLIRGSASFAPLAGNGSGGQGGSGPGGLKILQVTDAAGKTCSYAAGAVIIASGSEPASIPVPGAELPVVLNSDAVLSLAALPESAVIAGGGVIGVEFATLFNSLGKKVTVIEMLPAILNGMDGDISAGMARILSRRGVEIHTGAKLLGIRQDGPGAVCSYEEGGVKKEAAGSVMIMAVGRRPVSGDLNLAAVGAAETRGFITVNEYMESTVPGIYAIGDVSGKVQLAHAAGAQALIAAANAAAVSGGAADTRAGGTGKKARMDYAVIPACVYTNPEIASVGKTEEAIQAAGIPHKTGNFPAAGNGRSLIMGSLSSPVEGFVKIISHEKTGEILGAHIMAPRATDLIGEIAAVMKAEGTIEELADTIHPHPTVSEMIMEAAQAVLWR